MKKNTTKRTLVLATGLAGALAASADTFRWAKTGTMLNDGNSKVFYTASSWTNNVVPPLDGTETLNFVLTSAYNSAGELDVANNNSPYYGLQHIALTTNGTYGTRAADPFVVKVGSITGSQPRQSLNAFGRHVVIDCPAPDGFAGPWRILANGASGFTFTNDGTSAPTLNFLENGYYTYLKTETATTKAVVGGLISGGTFNKTGPGTLKIASASDLQATCNLHGGTLALGRAATDVEVPDALADGAVFHVDAMATDSLTTETGSDGKTLVTAWRDLTTTTRTMGLSDDDAKADWSAPRLIVTNGVPLVDFGAHEQQYETKRDGKEGRVTLSSAAQSAELGRAATLSTPNASRVKSVREVFVVAEVTSDNNAAAVYFCGGNWTYGWSLGTKVSDLNFLGSDGLIDPTVGAGKWLVDGAAKTAVSYPETRRLLVYSIRGNRALDFTHLGGHWRDTISGSAVFGGIRIGELVAYSRELTDAERLANQRYLMDKWHVGSERTSWDMGTVLLRAEGLSLDVGEGDVARVRRVRGTSSTFGATNARFPFSKTGDGELVLEDVYPSSLPIHVLGGSVSFTTTIDHDAVAAAAAPASGAFCHLDSTQADTLLKDASGGITNWTDCAGRATSMRPVSGRPAPTAVASDKVDGKTVVDFGEEYVNSGAAMQLYNGESTSSERMYDVFVVVRKYAPNSNSKIFASTGWELVGGDGFAGPDNGVALSIGANWTANGRPASVDSVSGENSVTNFNVYGMSVSQTPAVVNALGYWCSSGPNGGGIQVAEWIAYTRRLTDAERLQTQAYLMKKWGKGAHPDAAVSSVGAIDFASGVTPTVGTDSPRTVASVTAADANATFVKTGAGLLTVGTLANVGAVQVTGGALTVTGEQNLTLSSLTLDAAAFADDAAPRVSVNGTLTLAAGGTLSATVPDEFAYGEWQVAAATAVAADGLASWTVTVASESGAKVRGTCELVVRDGGVWFCHRRRGSCLIIR